MTFKSHPGFNYSPPYKYLARTIPVTVNNMLSFFHAIYNRVYLKYKRDQCSFIALVKSRNRECSSCHDLNSSLQVKDERVLNWKNTNTRANLPKFMNDLKDKKRVNHAFEMF